MTSSRQTSWYRHFARILGTLKDGPLTAKEVAAALGIKTKQQVMLKLRQLGAAGVVHMDRPNSGNQAARWALGPGPVKQSWSGDPEASPTVAKFGACVHSLLWHSSTIPELRELTGMCNRIYHMMDELMKQELVFISGWEASVNGLYPTYRFGIRKPSVPKPRKMSKDQKTALFGAGSRFRRSRLQQSRLKHQADITSALTGVRISVPQQRRQPQAAQAQS